MSVQMMNGIAGHYNYNKTLRFWGVVDGVENGYTESELPEKRKCSRVPCLMIIMNDYDSCF